MLLLTVREWLGPGRRCPPNKMPQERERLVGMVTWLSLPDALKRLHQHQEAYNEHFEIMGVAFGLVSVSQIDALNADDISNGGLEVIERLKLDYCPEL